MALAHWLFDRARAGEAQRIGAYVDAGVPVDLTDAVGNTLLILAAHRGRVISRGYSDVVQVLIAAGAAELELQP